MRDHRRHRRPVPDRPLAQISVPVPLEPPAGRLADILDTEGRARNMDLLLSSKAHVPHPRKTSRVGHRRAKIHIQRIEVDSRRGYQRPGFEGGGCPDER